MSTLTVVTYGNGQLLVNTFQAIVSAIDGGNGGAFHTLLNIAILMGGSWALAWQSH